MSEQHLAYKNAWIFYQKGYQVIGSSTIEDKNTSMVVVVPKRWSQFNYPERLAEEPYQVEPYTKAIAVVCGGFYNLVIIDVDHKKEEFDEKAFNDFMGDGFGLTELISNHPATLTKSGQHQFWFRSKKPTNRFIDFLPGVDILGCNSIAYLPGSEKDGGSYSELNPIPNAWDLPILPSEAVCRLSERLAAPAKGNVPKTASKLSEGQIDGNKSIAAVRYDDFTWPIYAIGQRNVKLSSMSYNLGGYIAAKCLDEDVALGWLTNWAQAMGLQSKEYQRVIGNAIEAGKKSPRQKIVAKPKLAQINWTVAEFIEQVFYDNTLDFQAIRMLIALAFHGMISENKASFLLSQRSVVEFSGVSRFSVKKIMTEHKLPERYVLVNTTKFNTKEKISHWELKVGNVNDDRTDNISSNYVKRLLDVRLNGIESVIDPAHDRWASQAKNAWRIFAAIVDSGATGLTRAELEDELELPRRTIENIIAKLIKDDLIEASGTRTVQGKTRKDQLPVYVENASTDFVADTKISEKRKETHKAERMRQNRWIELNG